MPTYLRLARAAATQVVPLPLNGSSTTSPGLAAGQDDAVEHADGHLAAVPPFALAESSADAAHVPGVAAGVEVAVVGLLRTEIPGVIGQLSLGIGAAVGVVVWRGAGPTNGVGVKGHVAKSVVRFLLREVEKYACGFLANFLRVCWPNV